MITSVNAGSVTPMKNSATFLLAIRTYTARMKEMDSVLNMRVSAGNLTARMQYWKMELAIATRILVKNSNVRRLFPLVNFVLIICNLAGNPIAKILFT